LDYQNNYVGNHSKMTSDVAKNFNILATSLNVLYNYFNGLKLFSDSYLELNFQTPQQNCFFFRVII